MNKQEMKSRAIDTPGFITIKTSIKSIQLCIHCFNMSQEGISKARIVGNVVRDTIKQCCPFKKRTDAQCSLSDSVTVQLIETTESSNYRNQCYCASLRHSCSDNDMNLTAQQQYN